MLGPILFTIYTIPVGQIAQKYGLQYHLYADDTQLYASFKPSDSASADFIVGNIESCFREIKIWMDQNLLKLNEDKTELLVATGKKSKNHGTLPSLKLDSMSKVGVNYLRSKKFFIANVFKLVDLYTQ